MMFADEDRIKYIGDIRIDISRRIIGIHSGNDGRAISAPLIRFPYRFDAQSNLSSHLSYVFLIVKVHQ